MEQDVVVREVCDDGTCRVIRIRESACSGDCHQCSGCGAAKEAVEFIAVDPIGVSPGDRVTVRTASAPVLGAAAIVYILPLVLFYVCYYIGALMGSGALVGGIGFLLGIVAIVSYDRLVARKKKTVYTITGYAQIPEKRG